MRGSRGTRRSLGRAGHHVEVVHRMPWRGDAGPVVAAWDQEHVAVADRHRLVDRAVGGVRAVQAEPGLPADPEVVDLLERDLVLGVLVVLVRGERRPVPVGREDLDGDQALRLERVGGQEVVDLPGRDAAAADLDRDGARRDVRGLRARGWPARSGARARIRARWSAATSEPAGRNAKSDTRENTSVRPSSSKRALPTSTVHEPASGSAAASIPSRWRTRRSPGARASTRSPLNDQPASAGVSGPARPRRRRARGPEQVSAHGAPREYGSGDAGSSAHRGS